jgi:uncharacterized protein (DUF983 family)
MAEGDHREAGRRAASAFVCGLRSRCPRCGRGNLFSKGLVLRDGCERCGLSYAFADAGDGPAVFAIFILGALVLGGALILEFKVGPPAWVHVLVWGVLTPTLAYFLLRVLKATLIALEYKHRVADNSLSPH